ncbi:hypothetical protein AVEN_128161-1 [Araneus ventricosus]|uniref:DUF4371 domain-containing protein n=1 Tax=Araneus ventricosus TaxID=182803 RepID=A0A4Y1ZZT2_ARAVE|nr:hypothetical protein AVEN_128161-1 [Araneus ventricosus]
MSEETAKIIEKEKNPKLAFALHESRDKAKWEEKNLNPLIKLGRHVTAATGGAKPIKEAILNLFVSNNMQLNGITVIGCDGTNVNTGHKGWYYSLDGTGLNRPLQWCICLLQTNELPLRHLLNSLDGATTGHKEFCRPIGKAIKTCEELPVAPFSSISVENMPYNIHYMPKSIRTLADFHIF